MSNPIWDGIEIDYDALDGYGWRVSKVSIDSVEYPLFLGYQVAALREMESRVDGVAQAMVATSTSFLSIGSGSKSLQIEAGKGFAPGARIIVADASNPAASWEIGVVDSYGFETGMLQYTVTDDSGGGAGSFWRVSFSGERGPVGSLGTGGAVEGDLTVTGNLTVHGAQTIINAQTVETEDNLILLNRNETGAGVTTGLAGVEVDRGTEPNYFWQFSEARGGFEIGEDGSLQLVATREESPLAGGILHWDDVTRCLKSETGFQWDGSQLSVPGAVKARGVPSETVSVASMTLSAGDQGTYLRLFSPSDVTLTIPLEASVSLPIDYEVSGIQAGTGQIVFTPEFGVTVNSFDGMLRTSAPFAAFTLKKVGADSWDLVGNLTA